MNLWLKARGCALLLLALSIACGTAPSEPALSRDVAGTYHITDSLEGIHWVAATGSRLTIGASGNFVWTASFFPEQRSGSWSVFDDTRANDTGYVRLLLSDTQHPPLWFVLRGTFDLPVPVPHATDVVVRHPTGVSAYAFSRD